MNELHIANYLSKDYDITEKARMIYQHFIRFKLHIYKKSLVK